MWRRRNNETPIELKYENGQVISFTETEFMNLVKAELDKRLLKFYSVKCSPMAYAVMVSLDEGDTMTGKLLLPTEELNTFSLGGAVKFYKEAISSELNFRIQDGKYFYKSALPRRDASPVRKAVPPLITHVDVFETTGASDSARYYVKRNDKYVPLKPRIWIESEDGVSTDFDASTTFKRIPAVQHADGIEIWKT